MDDRLMRLAHAVKARREQLGLTQDELAALGGPSDTTVVKIEKGKTEPGRQTFRKLDLALEWEPGSARRVMETGEAPRIASDSYETQLQQKRNRSTPRGWSASAVSARHRALDELPAEELFNRWADLQMRLLPVVWKYAQERGLENESQARLELRLTLTMSGQIKDGRPWRPPWEFPSHVAWLIDYARTEGIAPEEFIIDRETGETLADLAERELAVVDGLGDELLGDPATRINVVMGDEDTETIFVLKPVTRADDLVDEVHESGVPDPELLERAAAHPEEGDKK
ncbi:MAG: helix-turn-helix transcriptional regulator [Candidatus Nanopelagicales bacterium]